MNLLYIGAGFVGACSAAVSADSGHETLVFEIDSKKVESLNSGDRAAIEAWIYEDGLVELLERNRDRIRFTNDAADMTAFVSTADAVFLCLPTPEKTGALGSTDLTYYYQALESLGVNLAQRNNGEQTKRVVIVNKSTVPIDQIDQTAKRLTAAGVKNFGVVSNPEFLVEGKAIENSLRPDRVVVGAETEEDFAVMRNVYRRFYDSANVKYLEVNPYEAAAGKLLANFTLFSRIVTTYAVLGRTAEKFPNLSYEALRSVISSDPRIGSWGLYDSLFSGGSCFIKDAASLAFQFEGAGHDPELVRKILAENNHQLELFFDRAVTEARFDWKGKNLAVLGAAFKQDTNDIRNSGSILFIEKALVAGAESVTIFDPAASGMCEWYFNPAKKPEYARVKIVNSIAEALTSSQVLLLGTDWAMFRSSAEEIMQSVKPPYLIMDGRRLLAARFAELTEAGFDIISVGSPFYPANRKG